MKRPAPSNFLVTKSTLTRHVPLRRKTPLARKSVLKAISDNPVAVIKKNIQARLRELAILRDGGCVLRHYDEAGNCGGYRNDGELILQAEHLVTRSNSISYGDMRNIVCLCKAHHMYFKQQHGRLYWELIERHVGPDRWAWIKRIEADKKPHRFTEWDWAKIELGLKAATAVNFRYG